MRAYGFGFCVIEGGFIVLIALNRGSGLIPVPFVAHGNNHVETSSHEPRMGTIEIFERHRNHCGYHAACDKPADVNSHNTHPNRKEENQCSGSLSQ